MGWLEVRATIDAAIEALDGLAATTAEYSGDADRIGSHIDELYGGSNNELPHTARDHTASAADRAGEAATGYRQAAQLCRDYLAAVDPDGAAGSVTGLAVPAAGGPAKGGHGPAGSPPARQAVSDVSRGRSHVFPEQGPKGLADLTTRDDGIIALRSEWMDAGGHARLRHGGVVTEQQLKDRAMYGKDPVNGSRTDWETGGTHLPVRNATAFTTDSDLVFAEAAVWNSKEGRAVIKDAEANGDFRASVRVPASAIFGPDFRQHVRGQTRIGSENNPQGADPTQFTDTASVMAVYRRENENSPWVAYTCYPKP
ncbi:hypothetical protein Afil01_33620 [Actinorhabdospora filicis]|uniref:Uncharacterized protein n=1 Tax=Actinorhabdospora filicis TaxID=1785913 RepID=A0A9W6SMD5_9ACTN|nr:hypothetical protein [Actinorhabdospora filicis]GLZ78555.1 hypothetical protein Afil01_33620 [Actinorhabdospora filicis]